MDFLAKIRAVWRNISLVQRALLIAVVLTFGIVGALLVHWSRRPDMRMLYQQLSPEEASEITEKISEKGIPYELRDGGTTIYAPNQHIYQLRLDMAKEGLPVGEQGGYKIFDDEKIGISPFVQSVNLKRALQDELAKSIQMIEGVDYARVHIVSTEQSIFASKGGETSASVVLRLRPGYRLGALNIAAITHLVAGSVKDLKSENVTVIDSEGRLLSGESDQALANGAGTVQTYKERVEDNLEKKVEEMLTAVLGPGRAAVNIWATIDMNSTNTVTEKYDPKGVVTKEEIQSGSEGGPVGASASGGTASPGKVKKDETITTEYEVGKTVKQETILPGKITSLKVAAFVDLSPSNADANEAAGGTQAKIMQVADVQEIIKNALGLTDTSAIKVVDVKFNRPVEALLEEAPANWTRYLAIVRQASLGIMAICALLVLRVFRGAKNKAAQAVAAGQLAEAGASAGLLPAGAEGSESVVLRKQISGALRKNPEQVKQLFLSWIEEKED